LPESHAASFALLVYVSSWLMYGHVERIDRPDCAVIHVIAERLLDHSAMLGGLVVESHDFR
jgi:hypothetical protein